jgi:hypothetical protein
VLVIDQPKDLRFGGRRGHGVARPQRLEANMELRPRLGKLELRRARPLETLGYGSVKQRSRRPCAPPCGGG